MKKMILVMTLLIVLGMLSAGLWAYFAFLYTKPLSKSELAELTPDWSVVTHGNWSPWFDPGDGTTEWNPAASFNAWLATVPEDEKAWVELIQLYHEFPEVFQAVPSISTQVHDKRWSKSVELLDRPEAREAIDRLASAFQRPMLGRSLCAQGDTHPLSGEYFHTYDPDEFDAIKRLGHDRVELQRWPGESFPLSEERDTAISFDMRIGRLLIAAANHSLLNHEQARYMRLIDAAEGAARSTDEHPAMIKQTVRMVINNMTRDSIRWALTQPAQSFTDDQLVRFDEIARSHQLIPSRWQADALFVHDTIRRLVEPDGRLSFKTAASKLLQPGDAVSVPDAELGPVAQRILYSTNVMLNMPQPSPEERGDTSVAIDWLKTQRWKMNFHASAFLEGAAQPTQAIQDRIDTLNADALELRELLSMHRHALRHGEMPASNEEIDEDLKPD
jgi:hypothetical protein